MMLYDIELFDNVNFVEFCIFARSTSIKLIPLFIFNYVQFTQDGNLTVVSVCMLILFLEIFWPADSLF